MGRSYWFECSRCGYRAVLAGKPDRGRDFFVRTIVCHECKKLYDVVVKLRVPAPRTMLHSGGLLPRETPTSPPTFLAAMSRLPVPGSRGFKWKTFKPACPAVPHHRIQIWTEPGKCPQCGLAMEKNPRPYRIWD